MNTVSFPVNLITGFVGFDVLKPSHKEALQLKVIFTTARSHVYPIYVLFTTNTQLQLACFQQMSQVSILPSV